MVTDSEDNSVSIYSTTELSEEQRAWVARERLRAEAMWWEEGHIGWGIWNEHEGIDEFSIIILIMLHVQSIYTTSSQCRKVQKISSSPLLHLRGLYYLANNLPHLLDSIHTLLQLSSVREMRLCLLYLHCGKSWCSTSITGWTATELDACLTVVQFFRQQWLSRQMFLCHHQIRFVCVHVTVNRHMCYFLSGSYCRKCAPMVFCWEIDNALLILTRSSFNCKWRLANVHFWHNISSHKVTLFQNSAMTVTRTQTRQNIQ